MISQGTSAQTLEASTIADYNSQLAAAASSFQSANSGTKTWVYDANALIRKLLASPTAYGFADNTTVSVRTVCPSLISSPRV